MTGLNVSHAGRPDGKTNRRVTHAVALVGYPSANSYFHPLLKLSCTANDLSLNIAARVFHNHFLSEHLNCPFPIVQIQRLAGACAEWFSEQR
jgi:hypothetical protein